MMDMIERVARAMCPHPSEYGDFLDWVNNDPERCFLALSRKAIEAMREPTDEMTDVGAIELRSHGRAADRDCEAAWRAMIDAALGPQEND